MRFRLAPRSMTLVDLELLQAQFFGIFRYFAFLGEQKFVVDGVTVKNASDR